MNFSSEVSSNYLLDLNPQQLSIVSKYINDKLVCPITFDILTFPHISPCGHTFDYPSICQALEHKKICPLDRQPLTIDTLVQNSLVKELIEHQVMIVFLAIQGESFQHDCAIAREPLFEAVKLPCGHTFSKSGITKWYEKRKYCPLDNKEFDISDMVYNPEKSQLAQEQYPGYLKKVKLFNLNLSSKITDFQLDDRNLLIKKLFEVLTCPISRNIIETPVIGTCGHTFDIASINDESSCPYDSLKLTKAQVVPNRIAKELLECFSSKLFKEMNAKMEVDREDRKGVFLFLKPDTTLDRIGKIAMSLGILGPIKHVWHYPKFCVKGRYLPDREIPISQIKSLNEISEGIPVLHMLSV
jgi:uncharacterized protein YbaR (Trm112 family)